MSLPKVLITNTVPDNILKPLDGIAEVILGPDGGLTTPREEVLRLAPELSAIINPGYDNFNTDLMAQHGVWATNTPDAFYEATADLTIALILNVGRMVVKGDRYIRSGQWKRFEPGVWDGVLLRDKILGIVGYGRTGQAVAERARAFGMSIIYNRRQIVDDPEYRSLDDLLKQSDFVSLHTPLNDQTRHMINKEKLALMKEGAYLINMARGPVVDEDALVQALKSGHLAGAALDVHENEPKVHAKFIDMDNVVLTPHVGGGTNESRHMSRLLCAENVALVLQGEAPQTPVNDPRSYLK